MSQKPETRAAHSSLVPSPYPLSPITLLTHFDAAARTPADVARLKQLILQLAVRGRLAPQDADDEPAGALLARIAASRAANGDKRPRNDSAVAEDEAPYPLPMGWRWVRLPDIYYSIGQKVPDETFTYIDVSSIDNERGAIKDDLQVLSPHEAPSRARKLVKKGSVIYSTVRPYLLNVAVIEREYAPLPIVSTAFAVMHPYEGIVGKYLFYYLRSRTFVEFVEAQMTGMAYPAINDTKLNEGLVPLPPTAEQHRIVAQVDHLLAQADELAARLAAAETQRRRAHAAALARLTAPAPAAAPAAWPLLAAHFDPLHATPDALAPLRAAILQLAVMGRLVPQDAKEEPAEGVLERIAREKDGRYRLLQEDKASDPTLPAGWQWVTISEIAEHRLGKMLDAHKNTGKLRPYVRNLNVQWLRFELSDIKQIRIEDNEKEEYALRPGDLLICEGGEPGRCAIWEDAEREMYFQKALHRVRPYKGVEPKYLLYHLWADALVGKLEAHFTGATIKHFTGKALRAYRVALPPSREQVRIVAKIEALLSQIDQLAAHLTAAETTRQRWLEAVVAGAGG